MDRDNAIAALTANGMVKMEGVRGDTYAYSSKGTLTYVTLRDAKFFAEGDIAVLPMMMGYSKEEVCEMLAAYRNETKLYGTSNENEIDAWFAHHVKTLRKKGGK